MNVPYEELGPGQKGRLVYQVMGKNGPLPNPKGIRYLDPGNLPDALNNQPAVGPSGIRGALAVSHLLLQAVEAGASVHKAIKLREIESHLSSIRTDLRCVERKVDHILEKLGTIQRMEAESALRGDLRFLVEKKHVDEMEVNVAGIADATIEAIERFERLAETPIRLGDAGNLSLSIETRDLLERIFSLLYNLRRSALETVNRRVMGNPAQCLTVEAVGDYWPATTASAADVLAARQITYRSYHSKAVRRWIGEQIREALREMDPVAQRLQNMFYQHDLEIDKERYEQFRRWWVWESDAGLLYRTRKEARGVREGYDRVFGYDPSLLPAPDPQEGLFYLSVPNRDERVEALLQGQEKPPSEKNA
jgi:hypothetical protein